jgi:hypothetical protein
MVFESIGLRWKDEWDGKPDTLKLLPQTRLQFRLDRKIYYEIGMLVEIHEKYPIDKGHIKIENP